MARSPGTRRQGTRVGTAALGVPTAKSRMALQPSWPMQWRRAPRSSQVITCPGALPDCSGGSQFCNAQRSVWPGTLALCLHAWTSHRFGMLSHTYPLDSTMHISMNVRHCAAGAFAEKVLVTDEPQGCRQPQTVQGVVIRSQRTPGTAVGKPELHLIVRCKRAICSAGALHTPALLLR